MDTCKISAIIKCIITYAGNRIVDLNSSYFSLKIVPWRSGVVIIIIKKSSILPTPSIVSVHVSVLNVHVRWSPQAPLYASACTGKAIHRNRVMNIVRVANDKISFFIIAVPPLLILKYHAFQSRHVPVIGMRDLKYPLLFYYMSPIFLNAL